jgi:hypothetical protein
MKDHKWKRMNTRFISVAAVLLSLVLAPSSLAYATGQTDSAGSSTTSLATVPPAPTSYVNQDTNVNLGQSGTPGAASPLIGGTCYSGYTCFWVSINEGGDNGQIQGTNGWWGAWTEPQCTGSAAAPDSHQTWNDCTSSLWDTQAVPQTFYVNINQGGTALTLGANQYQAQLTFTPSGNVNDAISSNQRG